MNLLVRPADPADLGASAEISQRAFARLREVYRPTAEHAARERESPADLDHVVAECDGRVVGTVRIRHDTDYWFVIGLAVDPAFQRQGIARAMLDWLYASACQSGHGLALATIRETGNVAVFERLGFEVVKEEPATWCESDRFETLHDVYLVREVGDSELGTLL